MDLQAGTAGGTYSVNVTPALLTSEGLSGTPVDITGSLPYLGGILALPSYYVVTGLANSTNYRVQLGNLTNNVDVHVFSDVNFSAQLCVGNQSSIAETCEATSTAGGELYIRVRASGAETDVAFIVDVLTPVTDEGSAGTPVDLTGILPYEGGIKTTASYYKVSGLVPSASYTVELINMIGQGSLEVFSDSGFTTSVCTDDRGGNWPESCTVNADGSGALYFQGLPGGGFSSAGATYRVQIK